MSTTKIQPGGDLHLTVLMARHSLNFVTGTERAALLAYGRDVFTAGAEHAATAGPATPVQIQALYRARRALHAIGNSYDDSELRTRALEADEEIDRVLAAAPQAPAARVGLPWRTGIPPWTDDRSVRVIAVTAHDDFGGVQVHDIRASDFHTDGDGDGAEVARVCTHWAYRDDIWPRADAAAPAAPAVDAPAKVLSQAARDVLAERQRQIDVEGWTPEHDDEHSDGSLSMAAACYALAQLPGPRPYAFHTSYLWTFTGWPQSWFKVSDRRRNLVKSAALNIAELERLDRAAAQTNGGSAA